jgi:dynein heavy chain
MHAITKESSQEYAQIPRTEWVKNWPGQVVLAVSQMYWTIGVEEALAQGKKRALIEHEEFLGN